MPKEIDLPLSPTNGDVTWVHPERQYHSDIFDTEVVTNVSQPRLIECLPEAPNGTAVVVCPGGGFHALSINSEGLDVARWLNARGVTVFVLKYRLVPGQSEDAVRDLVTAITDREELNQRSAAVIPLAFADGLNALAWVRDHAADYGVDPARVGILGFSAGGAVTAHAGIRYTARNRPAFMAPVYASASALGEWQVPEDAPPQFLLAATDDQLGLAADSVALYEQWRAAGKPVELHMYAAGGHGFGMKQQSLPSDGWIELFHAWLCQQGFCTPA